MTRLTTAFAIAGASLFFVGCTPSAEPTSASTSYPQKRSLMSAVQLGRDEIDAPATLKVSSPAFANGAPIPVTYSAYGEDASPPLLIEGIPPQARALAILMEDPDATEPKPFVHWILWNLPPEQTLRTAVPATHQVRELSGALQGRNSRGSVGYFGPKPPVGDAPHRYHFQVFALAKPLDLQKGSDKNAFVAALKGNVLAQGEVVGTFAKKAE